MGETAVHATGRRKRAVARVILTPGAGNIKVNDRSLEDYFARATWQMVARQALEALEVTSRFDVRVNVCGGGLSSQAEAVRHGISRALSKDDGDARSTLRRAGFITRDAREKERKKYGQPGARKKFQYSKR